MRFGRSKAKRWTPAKMDSAFAQRVRGFVPKSVELFAVSDGRPPGRPEAAVEDAPQARPSPVVLDAPDLPAHDRLGRVRDYFRRGSNAHDI